VTAVSCASSSFKRKKKKEKENKIPIKSENKRKNTVYVREQKSMELAWSLY